MLSPLESNHCAKTIGVGTLSKLKQADRDFREVREGTNPFLNSFANVEIVRWPQVPEPRNHQVAVVMDRDGKGR